MLSKSNSFSLAFVALATLLVCLSISEQTLSTLIPTNLIGGHTDVFLLMVLIVLGVVATLAGADSPIILIGGSMAGFIILTAHQDQLVRYLTLAAMLFSIGAYGMVASRNAVRVLISIELMLNAVNINLVTFARFVDPVRTQGQMFAIFILIVAAAEAAVGLAIVLAIYRNMSTVDMEKFNLLKW